MYGVPKIWCRWAPPPWCGSVGVTLETRSCPVLCYHTKFRRCRWNRLAVITEILRKILTICVPPDKVTQGHWNGHGSIGCVWLPISAPYFIVTTGLSRTVCEKNGDFCRKSKFSPPRYIYPPLREFPLEFCNGGNAQKLSHAPTRRWNEFFLLCAFV